MQRFIRSLLTFFIVSTTAGGLSPAAADAAGHPEDLEGRLEVIHSDDFTRGKAEFQYTLYTDRGEALELQFDEARPTLPATERIRVRGTRRGSVVAAESGSVQPSGVPVAAPVAVEKKVAVILFKFSNTASTPYTKAYAEGVAFTNNNSVKNYYWENTWGQWDITGQVFEWVTIPVATGGTCDYVTWANLADTEVKNTHGATALDGFGYKAYGFPSNGCGWSGLAYLPGTRSWLQGTGGMDLGTFAHELGHNFGTHHASTMSCTVGGLRKSISDDTDNCSFSEYGDPYSLMGQSGSGRHHTHFAMGNFNLLQAANTQDVTGGGAYTVADAESYQPALVQSLRVARPLSKYLYLELRRPYGQYFDHTMPEGVYLRIAPGYTSRTQSWLVDPTEANTTFNALPLNTPVYDPVRGATFTVTAIYTDPLDGVRKAAVDIAFATDNTAPTQPTGLTATPASASSIALNWASTSDDVGVAYYRVYRNGTLLANLLSGSSFTNTGLAGNTTYTYEVVAYDNSGQVSAKSAPVSATTQSTDTTKPSDVTGVAATALSSLRMSVTWNAATDNVGVASYELSRSTGSGSTTFTVISSAVAGTSFTDTGLVQGETYNYRVRARDTSNNLSLNYSNIATAVAGVDVTAPSTPSLTATAASSSTINLSWSGTDNFAVTSYLLRRGTTTTPDGTWVTAYSGTATSLADNNGGTGLQPSTTYYYQVTALDAAGLSTPSAVNSATTLASDTQNPSNPTLTVKVSKGKHSKATLNWTAATDNVGVVAYDIYKDSVFRASVSGSSLSYTDPTVLPSTYSIAYQVKPRDAAGNTGASNTVTITK